MSSHDYNNQTPEELEVLREQKIKEYTSTRTDMNDLTKLYKTNIHDPEILLEQMKNNAQHQSILQAVITKITNAIDSKRYKTPV